MLRRRSGRWGDDATVDSGRLMTDTDDGDNE